MEAGSLNIGWVGRRLYDLIRLVLFIFYKAAFRFRHYGSENVPPEDGRGLIITPNHASYLDPPLIGISLKRRVTFLAKEYLFKNLIVGTVLRTVGAFPIKSEKDDFKSIRDLIRILKGGRCVVVFPEGTRSPDGNLQAPEGGVGFLAIKSRSWIVPVYLRGTYDAFPRHAKFFKPGPIDVFYGTPFVPADDAAIMASPDPYLAVSQRILNEITRLRDAAPPR